MKITFPEIGIIYSYRIGDLNIKSMCIAQRYNEKQGFEFLLGDKWFDERLLEIYEVEKYITYD